MSKANIDNIDKLIRYLKRLKPGKFIMGSYIRSGNCGTVGCLAGWSYIVDKGGLKNIIVYKGGLKNIKLGIHIDSGIILGIAREFIGGNNINNLFMIKDRNGDILPITVENFDFLPSKDRKKLMLEALELYKTDGESHWKEILERYNAGKVEN